MKLTSIFSQQPVTATIKPLLETHLTIELQNQVVESLKSVDERYQERIFKLYVQILERENCEISSDLWEQVYSLKHPSKIAARKAQPVGESLVKYEFVDSYVVIPENRDTLVAHGETGHRTWESSLGIVEYICTNINEVNFGKAAIELGAGTGLVSLAIAQLNLAETVIATDYSPAIIQKLEDVVQLNQLKVDTEVVDWTDLETVNKLPKHASVLAGDILYGLESIYPQILDALDILKPAKVLFCNPIRNPESYNQFKGLCASRNIKINVLQRFPAQSHVDTKYMFIVSVPPIEVELIELACPDWFK